MLLEHGHDHSFTYCLRLLSLCKSGAVTETIAHKAKRTCYLVLQKSLRTSALTREHFSPLFLRYLISNVFILDMHFSFILGSKTVAPSLSPPQKNLSFVNSIKNTYMIVDGRALTGLESQLTFHWPDTDGHATGKGSQCKQINTQYMPIHPVLDPGGGAPLEKKGVSSCPHGVTFADFRGSLGSLSVDLPFPNELKSEWTCPLSLLHYLYFLVSPNLPWEAG